MPGMRPSLAQGPDLHLVGDSADPEVHEADRRIALALFRAQSSGEVPTGLWAPRHKTFAEIVALVRHTGWTQAFRALKLQGLIAEQTLGHVVARWSRPLRRSKAFSPETQAALRAASSPLPSRIG